MKRRTVFFGLIFSFAITVCSKDYKPNIVYILADDLGVGDISYLNSESKISTPNIDKIAKNGMYFSDAHSSASVCTPTRYGLLTGRYSWRTNLKEHVLNSYAACLIGENQETVAKLARRNGYTTAMIGKWHLGLNWQGKEGKEVATSLKKGTEENVDFSKPITFGPNEAGFDYWYGTAASWDFPPYGFIENNLLTNHETIRKVSDNYAKSTITPEIQSRIDTAKGNAKDIKKILNDYPKAAWRTGVVTEGITKESALSAIADKAVDYIENYKNEQPLFLYVPLTAPHTPVSPGEKFIGKSNCGLYGDFVQEMDYYIGKIADVLKSKGMWENTLFVFTADNGASLKAIPPAIQKKYNHSPSYIYSGFKAKVEEGGHRVPFIVSWPNVVKKGTSSDALISLNDLYATMAQMFEEDINTESAPDSYSMLWALLGKDKSELAQRNFEFHHTFPGRFGFRYENWKLDLHKGKMFDLSKDIKEKNNVRARNEELYNKLVKIASDYIRNGRSTEGEQLKNDGSDMWPQIESWIQ